jgi:Flp pilus assembly pilin Flp
MGQGLLVVLWGQNETGQDLVEYALVLAFVVLLAVSALALLGGNLQDYYGAIVTGLPFGS